METLQKMGGAASARYFLLLIFLAPLLLSCESSPPAVPGSKHVAVYEPIPHSVMYPATDPLNKRIDVAFEGTPLGSVIQHIAKATDSSVSTNWAELLLVGVEQDLPIDLHLNNIPAWKTLDLVLEQASAISGDLDPVGWQREGGVVMITTVRELKRHTVLMMYDIRHLISPPTCCDDAAVTERVQLPGPCFPPQAPATTQPTDTYSSFEDAEVDSIDEDDNWCGTVTGRRGSIFDPYDSEDKSEVTREELIMQVTDILTETVGTIDEWGALESTLREFNGYLIIKTTPKNHRDIRSLLSILPPPECWRRGKKCGA